MTARKINVLITADTRRLKLELMHAEFRLTRSRWRRPKLRFQILRLERNLARKP